MTTLTPADIAADLSVSLSTVQKYLTAGQFKGCAFQVVPGGRWHFDADLYATWKAGRAQAVDPNRIEPRTTRSRAALKRTA